MQCSVCVKNKPNPPNQSKTNREKKHFPTAKGVPLFFLNSKIENWTAAVRFCCMLRYSLWGSEWSARRNSPEGGVSQGLLCKQCSVSCGVWSVVQNVVFQQPVNLRGGLNARRDVREGVWRVLQLPLSLLFWLICSLRVSCRWSVMLRFVSAGGECTFFTVLGLFTHSKTSTDLKCTYFYREIHRFHDLSKQNQSLRKESRGSWWRKELFL